MYIWCSGMCHCTKSDRVKSDLHKKTMADCLFYNSVDFKPRSCSAAAKMTIAFKMTVTSRELYTK